MAGYTCEYSNFPEELINLPVFKDVDDTIGDLINEIESAKNEGRYGDANELINKNATRLYEYIVDAKIINTLVESIRNTQIYAKQVQQNIYIGDKPEVTQYGDIRIGQPSV